MRRWAVLGLLFGYAAIAAAPSERERSPARLGLAVDLPAASASAQRQVFEEVRRTGVSVFALSVSWSSGEPSAGVYDLSELTRAARLLRQSGAMLHLDLPLVSGRNRDVPADLATVSFDDPKLSLRLGRFLQALAPALLDFSTLSLGYRADAFFADKPEELKAYRRLFLGAVQFLGKLAPELKAGVTTAAPTESAAPAVAAALHQRSPVLFYIYAPFVADAPFLHRPPRSLEKDWGLLLERSAGRPIAFPEVSYSSAVENGGSPEKQAEFVKRLRRFVAAADGRALLFARYVSWRDLPGPGGSAGRDASDLSSRRAAFFAHRGLQTATGEAKPAWLEWVRDSRLR